MMMQIVFLCSVLLVSQAADMKEKAKYMQEQFEVIKRTCATIHGITMEQIKDVEAHFDEPRNKKDKCVLECLFTESGVMKNGRFNRDGADNITEYMYEDDEDTLTIGKEIAKTCEKKVAAVKSKDGCDAAFEIYKCLKKESKRKLFKQDGADY